MSDQEAQDDARRAAEALLLRAEQRLSSPTGASAGAGSTSGSTSSTTPTAAAAAQQAQASLKSALTKAQGSIKSAQDKMSASIEIMEKTAVEKMEAVAAKTKIANAGTDANAGGTADATGEVGPSKSAASTVNADASESEPEANASTASAASSADSAASMKAALGRAQGSIRSFQENMSTSLDAVKTQTQEKVSASLSVVKQIDSSSSTEAKSTEAAASAGANEKIEKLKSESTAMVQEAGKSMKSAFRLAQGKMTASMQSLKLETAKQRATGTNATASVNASATDQQDIDAKMFSDIVLEQIELCKSMMMSQNDDTGDEKGPPSEALLAVVGNLETSSARLASLIDAGAEGELDEETMERVLSVHDELRKTLDEFCKTMPPPTTEEETSATSVGSDGAIAAVAADTSPTSDGGDSAAESEKPGMELGNTTAL